MTANFCGSCGATLLSGTKFCPNCGKPVAHAAPPAAPLATPPSAAPVSAPTPGAGERTQVRPVYAPPPPPPPSRRRLWIMVGTAALVVVAGALAAVIFLVLHAGSPQDQARDAVRSAYDNYYFGRCEQASKYIDGPHDDVVKQCHGETRDVAAITVGRSVVHGTQGTVAVTVTRKSGAEGDHVVHLSVDAVKTGDGWKAGWK